MITIKPEDLIELFWMIFFTGLMWGIVFGIKIKELIEKEEIIRRDNK